MKTNHNLNDYLLFDDFKENRITYDKLKKQLLTKLHIQSAFIEFLSKNFNMRDKKALISKFKLNCAIDFKEFEHEHECHFVLNDILRKL